MRAETRALLRLNGRRIGAMGPWGLLALAAASALMLMLGILLPTVASETPWRELVAVGLAPLLAAGAGAAAPGAGSDGTALDWLRARAVRPRRLLATSLAWQLLALVLFVCLFSFAMALPMRLAVALTGNDLPPLPLVVLPGVDSLWSSLLDAPLGTVEVLAHSLYLTCFTWALALAWLGQGSTAAQFGGLLLGWSQVAATLGPAAVLSGRAQEGMEPGYWLLPGLLAPPLMLAGWAWHRWDPLAAPWPARTAGATVAAALLFATLSLGLALAPALEARALSAAGPPGELPGVASVRTLIHPQTPQLVAHELVLEDGTTRVRLDDGVARRQVMPRGTTAVGWYEYGQAQQLVIDFGHGCWRRLRPDGSTGHPPPEAYRDLVKYREALR